MASVAAAHAAPAFREVAEWLVPAAHAAARAGAQADSTPALPARDAWRIQIGAYSDAAEAGRRIEAALSRASDVLRGKGPATVPVKTASRTLYRARFTGFPAETTARNACAALIREGISCITVPPEDWYAPGN
ncbi:MAG: hypothetical protein Kow0045_10520 [Albidovulum sp.]